MREDADGDVVKMPDKSMMRYFTVLMPVAVAVAALPLFLNSTKAKMYTDIAMPVLVSAALFLCLLARRAYRESEFSRLCMCFAAFLAFYLAAYAAWDVYEFAFHIGDPFPSVADIFWLLGYVPIGYICVWTVIRYHEYSRPVQTYSIFTVMFFVSALVLISIIGVTLSGSSGYFSAGTLLTVVYTIFDMWLITMVLVLVSIYRKGKLGLYWIFIFAALMFELTGDILYKYLESRGMYSTGSLPDVFFMLCQLSLIIGFSTIIWAGKKIAIPALEPSGRYTIKHVFLVYGNGTLISHFSDTESKMVDADIFSGMLTAVQAFIRDSFKDADDAKGGLGRLRYMSLEIAIEHGRKVYLAVVVDGRVTDRLHDRMKAIIGEIETKYTKVLEDWDGVLDSLGGVDGIVKRAFR